MPKLFTINNSLIGIGNTYLGEFDRYTVTTLASEHGTVIASPTRGLAGTIITLTPVADTGYTLDYFTVNGMQIVGDSFVLTQDVSVAAIFKQDVPLDEVTIGTQTWKTSYVEFNDGGAGIYYSADTGVYYYAWSAISRIITSLVGTGYHVPSRSDFITLMNYVGPDITSIFNALASTSGWTNGNGLNTSGFNAEAHGYYDSGTHEVGTKCYLGTCDSKDVFFDTLDIPFYLSQTSRPPVSSKDWSASAYNVPVRLIKD